MATVNTNPPEQSSQTTSLPIDLRSVPDFTVPVAVIDSAKVSQVTVGVPAQVIRQVMAMGDPAIAALTVQVVKGGVAQGNENALAVALVPGSKDLQEIKQLLFEILQQLVRNGVADGAGPSTNLVSETQGVS